MPVPSAITDLSPTPASNSPAGSESPATTDDYFRSHAAFIAQLRAVIGGATDANIPASWPAALDLITQAKNSGTTGGTSTAYTLTPATAIASYSAGMTFWVRFHVASGASPTLMISGLASPPALVRQNASGAFVAIAAGEIPLNHASRVTLLSASQALVEDMPPTAIESVRIDVASAATVNLSAAAPTTRHIQITGTTTIAAFTVAAGAVYFVRFGGTLTLTNNGSIVTQTGDNITTQAGDTCIIRATADSVVEVLSYCRVGRLVVGTAQSTTSGTAIDFTGIPSWARRITVMLFGVSTSGTGNNPIIQLGTSGGIDATGYNGQVSAIGNGTTPGGAKLSAGFACNFNTAATSVISGALRLNAFGSNTWICEGSFVHTDALGRQSIVAGDKTLAGTLDRIRLTTVNGTDTFDAGSVNIIWEG